MRRRLISAMRYRLLRLRAPRFFAEAGFVCGRGCFVSRKNEVRIGRNFYMGNYCHLGANATIGNDVMFASFVSMVGGDHQIDGIAGPIRLSGRDEMKEIVVEDDVWVGHGAIILHGVRIGRGAVIGAGSVVTHDVGTMCVVAGNPAKKLRTRTCVKSTTP